MKRLPSSFRVAGDFFFHTLSEVYFTSFWEMGNELSYGHSSICHNTTGEANPAFRNLLWEVLLMAQQTQGPRGQAFILN